ncbi:MAG: helix-turn-helix transcriptional regulator [Pirellulales bacterium]|nr:helix-turn-helix transcriptional regulator [Pirellulales bacterium]
MPNRLKEYFRYLPPGPRDRQWGLYVTAAGYQPVPSGSQYPPKGHPASHSFAWERGRVLDQFGVVYIVHGKGEFESKQTGLCDLDKGDAFLVFPGVWHRYRPVSRIGWEVYWVHFQGEDAQRMQRRGFISPDEAVLKVGMNDAVLDPFIHLLDWLRAEPVGFQQMIASGTMQIIAAMLGAVRNQAAGSHIHDQVRRAKALLEEELDGLPLMEGIASELDMSRAHFFRIFKEHTGLTPYQYHLELKLNRARQMLRNSDLPVKQIARLLGFSNVYHFSKFFKNKTGMAPTPWRNHGFPQALYEVD